MIKEINKEKNESSFIDRLKIFIQEEMAKFEIPALSIAIIKDQELIWEHGFGWQDEEKSVKASSDTVYRVGSISKLFTAVAIMRLYEKGVLNIDEPITSYCPELIFENLSNNKKPITLRHLLSHRAGILRESPVGNYFDDTEPSISDTVKSIIGSKLIYQVGEKCKYSNLGPTIAGYILEKVTGQPFEEYMEDAIFKNLHMKSSSFLPNKEAIQKKLAKAYMIDFKGKLFPAPKFQLGTIPAGNLYSTVSDLARFMVCILDEGKFKDFELLKSETLKEMLNAQFNNCKEPPEFGLGFAIRKFFKYKMFWHNGIVYGFASDFTGLLDPPIGVILLNNVDSAVGFNEKLKLKTLDIILDSLGEKKYIQFPEIKLLNPKLLNGYEGKYHSKQADAWVWSENGHFFIKTMGVSKRICPTTKDKFITDDRLNYGLKVSFERDSRSKVISMIAGDIKYTKVKGYCPNYTIPEKLDKFIGDYGKPHNILRLFVCDGQLMCLIEWFYEYPLKEVDELTFAFPNYGLYDGEFIHFEQDTNNEIIAAVAGFVRFEKLREK